MTSLIAPARPVRPLTRDQQRIVIIGALVVVCTEILGLMGVLPQFDIGRMTLPFSVIPGAVLLGLLGRRAFGRPTSPEGALPLWVASILGMGFGTVLLARAGHLIEAPAVLVAAVGEEVVYRFAVPSVVAAVLLAWKVPVKPARIAGFAVAAVWFVLLPGHRMQVDGLIEILPFVAFAALSAVVAYRSGSIAATGAVHTVMNMLAILVLGGDVGQSARAVAVGCLLVLLVSAYGLSQSRPATVAAGAVAAEPSLDLTRPLDADVVIDLRDGVTPTVTNPDGVVTSLVEEADQDQPATR